MGTSCRVQRKADLEVIRSTDPMRLVVLYRRLTGLDDQEPLQKNTTYASIIDAILDCETRLEAGSHPPKATASRPMLTLNDPTITLIEHLRSVPAGHATRMAPVPKEGPACGLFGSIDVCDEGIDWLAAARFARR